MTEVCSSFLIFLFKKKYLIQFPFYGILSLEIRAQVKNSNQTEDLSHIYTRKINLQWNLQPPSLWVILILQKAVTLGFQGTSHTALLCRWVIRKLASHNWHPQIPSPGAGHFLSIHPYFFPCIYFQKSPLFELVWQEYPTCSPMERTRSLSKISATTKWLYYVIPTYKSKIDIFFSTRKWSRFSTVSVSVWYHNCHK